MMTMESEGRPMAVTELPWLYKAKKEIIKRYDTYPDEEAGKWMLFYDNDNVDAAWEEAKRLYDADRLEGISSMKVSTNYDNPRASRRDNKVIIFYCGPASDEESVMRYGRVLLREMRYARQRSGEHFPPFVYYKPDYMTFTGTRATGQKRNWLYRLQYC